MTEITPKMHAILAHLAEHGPQTCAKIGIALAPQPTGQREWAGDTLKRMWAHRLVSRTMGRPRTWYTTPAGRAALKGAEG